MTTARLTCRPPEAKVRAVLMLAQKAGAERVREAKKIADEHVQSMMHNSRQLVDHAADGNVDKMREELVAFADPNSTSSAGVAALCAAAGASPEAVALLLDFGAKFDVKDADGLSPLGYAARANLPKVILLLTKSSSGGLAAAKQGGVSLAQLQCRGRDVLLHLRCLAFCSSLLEFMLKVHDGH